MRRRPESLDHPHCRDICSNLSASIPLCWYRAAEYALRGAAGRATAGQIARLRETAGGRAVLVDQARGTTAGQVCDIRQIRVSSLKIAAPCFCATA